MHRDTRRGTIPEPTTFVVGYIKKMATDGGVFTATIKDGATLTDVEVHFPSAVVGQTVLWNYLTDEQYKAMFDDQNADMLSKYPDELLIGMYYAFRASNLDRYH